MKILRQSVCFALLCILVSAMAATIPAHANEPGKKLSRTDLMGLAKQFVSRVGGKLDQIETPPAPDENPLDRYEDHELFYLVTRIMPKRLQLERQITTIKHDNDIFVSLSDFVTAADFPITISVADKNAAGWYIRENKTFTLNVATHTVQSGDKTYEISDNDLYTDGTDIFVRNQTLGTWFNSKITVNLKAQNLDIEPSEQWPIEEKLQRSKNKNLKRKFRTAPALLLQDEPYDMVSVPNVDLQTRSAYIRPQEGSSEFTNSYTTKIAGDVLGHTGKLRITGDDEETINNINMSLYKESNKPNLLGPLKARRYEFGDISPVTTPLIGGGGTQLGAEVSNKDPYVTYDTTTQITGDAAPGWDVELFRNDQYLATVNVDNDGRYIFNDIPLFAKENTFKIVFYGPQGEIKEETKTYRVDPTLYESGKGLYDVSLGLQNSQIYNREDSDDEDKNTPHLAANYERQLTDNLAARTGVQIRQEDGDQKAYAQAGIVGTYNNTIINADTAVDNEGANAAALTARYRMDKHSVTGRAQYFGEDFNPGSSTPKAAEYVLGGSLNGPLPFKDAKATYDIDSELRTSDNGTDSTRNSIGLSGNIQGLRLSNTLEHTTKSTDADNESKTRDILSLRGNTFGLLWRLTSEYEIQPDSRLDEYEFEISKRLAKDLRGRVEFTHETAEENADAYSKTELSLDWYSKHALISPSVAYDSDKELTAMLNVRTSLTKNPYTDDIKFAGETLSDKGGISARVFLDKNGDNTFNEGEELLQDVKIKALHANRNADTDEKGEAFIYNIPDNRVTDVFVDEQSFTDPYWVSGFQGVSIRPRAGHVSRIEFPIHLAGEMDGTVYSLTENGTQNTVSNLRLALMDKNGKVTQNTITDADGFYWFTKIPPGLYTLTVDGEDARAKKLQTPLPQTIEIGFDGPILNGRNIMMDHNDHPAAIVNIASLDKLLIADPAFDAAKLGESKVLLNLGTYKSNLMMGLSWYKISFFNGEALAGAKPLVNPSDSYPAVRTGLHTLRALVPNDTTETAYQRCLNLSAKGYDCTVEILPAKPAEQIIGMR